jgi:hypothetical protein
MIISRIRVSGRIFEEPRFIGFASFDSGDGFLMIIESAGRKYAIALSSGKVYDIIERGTRLYVEIPYGKQTYRVPLRFKL